MSAVKSPAQERNRTMSTNDDLKAAFAGESQANRKYLAFAQQAEKDGFQQVAKLFRAVAEAETIHAHTHLRALGGIKKTMENLEAAIEGEAHEFRQMYPEFIARAEKENAKPALTGFKGASAVEEVHHGLFQKALESVKTGKDLPHRANLCLPHLRLHRPRRSPGQMPRLQGLEGQILPRIIRGGSSFRGGRI